MNNSYIRFLNLIDAIAGLDANKKLDATEEQLLDAVMLAYSQGREILVGDLIHLSKIGSQATLHGRVKNLVTMGYVKLTTDKMDGRKKKAAPTKLAMKHYDSLSKLLTKALSA